MTKKRKILTVILSVLIALTLGFIWSNSLRTSGDSANQSQETYSWIRVVLDFIFGEGVITHAMFRKMAHFGEFFILSLEINLLIITIKKYQIKRVWVQLLIGLAVAIVDELLQLLVGRGAMVKDVLIDFGGVVSITLIILIIYLIVKKRQGRKI